MWIIAPIIAFGLSLILIYFSDKLEEKIKKAFETLLEKQVNTLREGKNMNLKMNLYDLLAV